MNKKVNYVNKTKLHILATCQFGWPEPYPSMYPMEEMAKRGHYIHAITGTPNYPMGEVFFGYEKGKIIEEVHAGVHYTHVRTVPRKHDVIHRLLNYHSYPIFASKEIDKIAGDYDVVFANQSSPVMMVEPAIKYAKKWKKKVVMYCMDLWPASLEIGGIKKNSMLYKLYYMKSKKIYMDVDMILVTSRMFKKYFVEEFGIDEEKIEYLPQYAITEYESIPEHPQKETTDFVFAGNVGTAQNLQIVLKAAKIIEEQNITDNGKPIFFHIIGDGQELMNLKRYVKKRDIRNVIFHGRKSSSEMPKYYAFADAMVVSLTSNSLVTLTLPAKVQSYMAAGRPILASANGEIANVIRESGAGFCSDADDVQGFVETVKKFIDCQYRREMENKAKLYYEQNFSKKKMMDKLERTLVKHSNI